MIWFSMIMFGGAILCFSLYFEKKSDPLDFITSTQDQQAGETSHTRALNITTLTDKPLRARFKIAVKNLKARIGPPVPLKVTLFLLAVIALTVGARRLIPDIPLPLLFLAILVVSSLFVLKMLERYERKQFETSFPDALNLLNGAVGSGESLMHAIIYVGDSMDGMVGREFRLMGERLSLGKTPDEVLSQACERFPYPPFYFFAIALRANINHGGQLKEVIRRLNQIMFSSRALEKKKMTLTAEARMSARIMAAIPLCFLLMMKVMSPENFEFVMYEDAGRPIFYYVLISELLGLGIINLLMRRVKG
ncbi:type II secretion system F family protein [Spongorhabdus nitratireducens]